MNSLPPALKCNSDIFSNLKIKISFYYDNDKRDSIEIVHAILKRAFARVRFQVKLSDIPDEMTVPQGEKNVMYGILDIKVFEYYRPHGILYKKNPKRMFSL